MCLEQAVQPFAYNLQHFGIGEAPLARASRMPLSAEPGIVFRMLLPVTRRRQQLVAGMHPEIVHEQVVRLFQAIPVAVQRIGIPHLVHTVVGRGHPPVPQAIVAGLPVTEGRNFGARPQRHGFAAGQHVLPVPPVIHPHLLLQEIARGVHQTFPVPFQKHVLPFTGNAEGVFRKTRVLIQQHGAGVAGLSEEAFQDACSRCGIRSVTAFDYARAGQDRQKQKERYGKNE